MEERNGMEPFLYSTVLSGKIRTKQTKKPKKWRCAAALCNECIPTLIFKNEITNKRQRLECSLFEHIHSYVICFEIDSYQHCEVNWFFCKSMNKKISAHVWSANFISIFWGVSYLFASVHSNDYMKNLLSNAIKISLRHDQSELFFS